MTETPLVPRFYLYGEPHRSVDGRFVHVEALADRSRPSEWTIQPHAHSELNHIFHIREGGGAMQAELALLSFEAPCLLLVPAGVAHGFQWLSDSTGAVVTVATAYLHHLRACDADLAPLFNAPFVTRLEPVDSCAVAEATDGLMAELGWNAPGHSAAVESGLLRLLVRALRALGEPPDLTAAVRRDAGLVARFRERVEARFKLREPISLYAVELGVSETRMRSACARIAGLSPLQILDQRTLLEAKRALLYSSLSVSEISQLLGFNDPAYFSRFFARREGVPPIEARRRGPQAHSASRSDRPPSPATLERRPAEALTPERGPATG